MSANVKIVFIVIIGVGACLLSIFFSQYFREKDHNNQLLLFHIGQVSGKIEHIRLLGRSFIQDADQAIWDQISQTMEFVRRNLRKAPDTDGNWQPEIEALNRRLEDYYRIITQLYEPAVKMKAGKKALQELGLTFSREVEEEIIKPYRKEEGFRIYRGESIDPFKSKAKDAAYDLVTLHTKQQLILLELLLGSELEAYKQKKQHFSTALAQHKTRLRYMAVLMGNDPAIQSILDSLNQKLDSLIDNEQDIIGRFVVLAELDDRLRAAGDKLLAAGRDLSSKITSDTLKAGLLNQILNWSLMLGILASLSVLGALLARNIIQFVKDLGTAQSELKESEEKYRILLENLPQKLFYKDVNYVYVTCNENYAKDLNISPDEIKGKTDYDFFPKALAEKYRTDDMRVIKEKNTEELIEKYIQNGEEITVQTVKTIITNESGEVAGLLGIFWDITEQIKAREELKNSEERYRELVENAVMGFYQVKRNGEFIMVNRRMAGIFDYASPQELMADIDNIKKLYAHPEERIRIIKQIDDEGYVDGMEVAFKRKTGESVWVKLNTRVTTDKEGAPIYEGTLEDITEQKMMAEEQKKMEMQLQQAYRMEAIGTLAGGIAHDFNNILAAIIGYTEIAISDVERNTSVHNSLSAVLKAGDRAKNLVNQILTFSRQTEQESKPVQLKRITNDVLKLLRASIPATIEIRSYLRSESAIMADPTQIHQIVMNLGTNASYAMRDKGGLLEIRLDDVQFGKEDAAKHHELRPGSYVKLTLSDTGEGMEHHVMERIFDPFFTTKEKGHGTGMGLSVVHGIVKSGGGSISVQSESGKGTCFEILFPIIEIAPEPDLTAEESIPKGTERILFIDDENAIADLTKRQLESLGYQVTTRTDPIEALEVFKLQPDRFDMVITDMTMPKMTGKELSENLLRIKPSLPVILCTGFSASMDESRAAAIGIKALIFKPILKRDIAQAIRKVLD
jgi:PAS domain S-box-containing protein